MTPKGALDLKEECWNSFPYSKTVISNEYIGERLNLHVESVHLADRGETENALNLTPDQLSAREVIFIDIGEPLSSEEESATVDGEIPRLFKSSKTMRGPLGPNWIKEVIIQIDMTVLKCMCKPYFVVADGANNVLL